MGNVAYHNHPSIRRDGDTVTMTNPNSDRLAAELDHEAVVLGMDDENSARAALPEGIWGHYAGDRGHRNGRPDWTRLPYVAHAVRDNMPIGDLT